MKAEINFIKSEQRKMQWKQIEMRDNFVYFRWKQRIYKEDVVVPEIRLDK